MYYKPSWSAYQRELFDQGHPVMKLQLASWLNRTGCGGKSDRELRIDRDRFRNQARLDLSAGHRDTKPRGLNRNRMGRNNRRWRWHRKHEVISETVSGITVYWRVAR